MHAWVRNVSVIDAAPDAAGAAVKDRNKSIVTLLFISC
jgi:hypothetical protein